MSLSSSLFQFSLGAFFEYYFINIIETHHLYIAIEQRLNVKISILRVFIEIYFKLEVAFISLREIIYLFRYFLIEFLPLYKIIIPVKNVFE